MEGGTAIIFWSVLSAPVGLLVGAIIMFAGVPLFYRLRNIPKSKRRIGLMAKAALTLLFTLIFISAICGLSLYNVEKDIDDYWKSKGGWECWRMPLEEPYELCMIENMNSGFIGKWQNPGPIIHDIANYEKRGSMIAGCKTEPGWFFFDCKTGVLKTFESREQLRKTRQKAGFEPPLKMKSVRKNWYEYWKIIDGGEK